MNFGELGVGRRACQGMGEASCEGSRMGSEVAIMAMGESPYPLLWGGRPSVQQGSRAEGVQPKYQKSEKSGRDTMVNCSCK